MNQYLNIFNLTEVSWVNSFLMILGFVGIAYMSDLILTFLFKKVAKLTKNDLDDRIIEAIHKPIFFTILFTGIIDSLPGFGLISSEFLIYINRILQSLIIIFWTIAIIKIAAAIIENAVKKIFDVTGLGKDVIPLISSISKVIFVCLGLMAILSIWNIDITPLLASAGILSLVIALAAKDTFANFFGGISIFLDKPYKVGDYVDLSSGERGEVVNIGIRSTRIKTRDDILISIPNSIIANSKIINESAPVESFRVRVPIGVSYGSDIDLVEATLIQIASENSNILSDPAPRARFRKFGDSSLDYELLCWAKEPSLRGSTIHQLNKAIYKKFNELGIVIPFPQRDLHIYNSNPEK